jgi:hypothetical protein
MPSRMKKRPDRLPREVSLPFLVELEVAFLVLSLEQQAHGMNEFIRALQGGAPGEHLGLRPCQRLTGVHNQGANNAGCERPQPICYT